MADLPEMTSFFHPGLLLSMLVPVGWTGHDVEDLPQFRIMGPEHPEHDDYQPTMSFLRGEPEGFGDEWFDAFVAGTREQLARDHPGFELTGEDRFTLSSMAEVASRTFTWRHDESGLEFAQVQALIPASPFVLYVVNGATLRPLADTYLPVFDAILHSIRIMRARPVADS